VHIDVMPMPRSDAGNSCALMIIDRTTGAARAVPMKTKTSAEILEVYERTSMVPVGSGNRRCAHRDQRAK
jgi:hypothetical protein